MMYYSASIGKMAGLSLRGLPPGPGDPGVLLGLLLLA
jgi:hypothetical protein